MNTNYISEDDQNEDFNLRDTLEKYLIHWQWFVLGSLLCMGIAYVYLRYSTPQFQARTTILVKDEKKGGMLSELSAFSDMGLGKGMTSNLDNEIEILKSRTLVESTVKSFKMNVSLIGNGNVKSSEMYKDSPILVDFISTKPDFYLKSLNLEFIALGPDTFSLENKLENEDEPSIVIKQKEFRYGDIITTSIGKLIILAIKN